MTDALQRPRTLVLFTLAAVLAVVATVAVQLARGGEPEPAGFGSRTVQAGAVEVRMTALTLGASGARFRVELDTHAVALDLDLARAAQLRVNGRLADAGTWEGTGPGGHHREGTLRFATAVPVGASLELRITGLPAEAVATWVAP